jgi:hypothetical protein
VKLIRGHKPECHFVKWAHLNRPPAWTLEPNAEWQRLDAAGGKRGTDHTWLPFICPDDRECDALCLVELGSLLDDLHVLVGVPLASDASRAVRDSLILPAAGVPKLLGEMGTRLFTDGREVTVDRLVMEYREGEYRGAPGWSRLAVESQLADALRAAAERRGK